VTYTTVFEFMSDAASPAPINYVGKRGDPRTCRFCAPGAPGKFRERKHVIPEALGNKSLLSSEECDDCNQRASQFENDLAIHLALVRLFSRLPGKSTKGRKVEEFTHRFGRDKSRAVRSSFVARIALELFQGESTIRVKRIDSGFTLSARVPTYRLVNVAKALIRMAVFTCDDADLPSLAHCIRWLRGEERWPVPLFWQAFVPKLSGQHVGLLLQRNVAASDEAPFILTFTYAGMFMGVCIPDASWSPPKVIDLPNLGAITGEEVVATFVQFQGDGLREHPKISVDVHVPALEGVEAPTHTEISVAAHERFEKRGRIHGLDVEDWLGAEQDLLWEQVGRMKRADASGGGADI
jgi:hypothetical protein